MVTGITHCTESHEVNVRSLKVHFDLCDFVFGCKFKTARSHESAASAGKPLTEAIGFSSSPPIMQLSQLRNFFLSLTGITTHYGF
jgi:hypothetical protein